MKLLSDKSYFNRYTFIPNQEDNELNFEKSFYETNLGFETFSKHKYALVKLITFQNTLTNDTDYDTPFIAPYSEIDITKPLDKFIFGGNLNLYMSFMNCDFKGEMKDRKLFGKIGYLKNYVAANGIVLDFNINMLIHIINIKNQIQEGKSQINNVSPKLSFKISYPMEIVYKSKHMGILSPEFKFISSLIANKDFEGYLKYSNEFSDYFEINKTNLLYDDLNADINNCFIENRFVLGMMESMEPENDLRKETKAKLLGIPVIDVSINGVRSPLMVAVMTTANSLCKCFRNECRKIIYPDM